MRAVPNPIIIPVTIEVTDVTIPVTIGMENLTIPVEVATSMGGSSPDFDGPYEYDPSEEQQVIEIADHKATENIIINPVPSNYGRIEWNGVTLTVF